MRDPFAETIDRQKTVRIKMTTQHLAHRTFKHGNVRGLRLAKLEAWSGAHDDVVIVFALA